MGMLWDKVVVVLVEYIWNVYVMGMGYVLGDLCIGLLWDFKLLFGLFVLVVKFKMLVGVYGMWLEYCMV